MKDEILEIVDANDNVIGKGLRSEILREGKVVRVVNIFLLNSKKEILLPKRSMNRKLFPGRYDFSCGEHVIPRENYYDAAVRGLKEELGISNVQLKLLGKLGPNKTEGVFMQVYLGLCEYELLNYDKKGIDSFEWLTCKEILNRFETHPESFKPHYGIVLKEFLKILLDPKSIT